jgi:CBS domain-containing protein
VKVSQLCQRKAVTVRASVSLKEAAVLMTQKRVDCLIVVEPAAGKAKFRPVGILTDRDIITAAVSRGIDPQLLQVKDAMIPDPLTAQADESIETALPRMRGAGVRRVPVVSRCGELLGVLSFDDIFDAIANELRNIVDAARSESSFETTLYEGRPG